MEDDQNLTAAEKLAKQKEKKAQEEKDKLDKKHAS